MNDKIYKRMQELVRKECCNYYTPEKFCVPADKVCVMMEVHNDEEGNRIYKVCRWFDKCVLPYDDKLQAEVSSGSSGDIDSKECSVCGKMFVPTHGKQATCSTCRSMNVKTKEITKRIRKKKKNID